MKQENRNLLIQAIASGDPSKIRLAHEKLHENSVSSENILLCAHFLLNNGRPHGFCKVLSYEPLYIDDSEIETALHTYQEANTFDGISTTSLTMITECLECYNVLKEQKRLHELKTYRQLLTNVDF